MPILINALAVSVTYNLITLSASQNVFSQYNLFIKSFAFFTNFLLIKAKANTLILINAEYNNNNRFSIAIKKNLITIAYKI